MASSAGAGAHEKRFVRETGLAARIAEVAEPVIEDLGFRLVRIVVSGRDGGTVQIMTEGPDGDITIDECTAITRELIPVLDVHAEDVRDNYRIEISSPGIDRPLVRESDFERHVGHEAKVELRDAIDGRKRLRGRIDGFEDGEVRLAVDLNDGEGERVLGLATSMIASAKLVMTDELLREALRRQEARGNAGQTD